MELASKFIGLDFEPIVMSHELVARSLSPPAGAGALRPHAKNSRAVHHSLLERIDGGGFQDLLSEGGSRGRGDAAAARFTDTTRNREGVEPRPAQEPESSVLHPAVIASGLASAASREGGRSVRPTRGPARSLRMGVSTLEPGAPTIHGAVAERVRGSAYALSLSKSARNKRSLSNLLGAS